MEAFHGHGDRTDWGLQAISQLDVQLAAQPLLSLEQIAVRGRCTVRGHINWGMPLNYVKTERGDLQDAGVHLQFVLVAF